MQYSHQLGNGDTESEGSIDTQDGGNELLQPPPKVIEEVFSSMPEAMPQTKEEIVGWCSGNESAEDEDMEEEPVQRNTKLLPSTAKELYDRFEELKELISDFKEEAGDEYANDVLILEKLIGMFILEGSLHGKPIIPTINEVT